METVEANRLSKAYSKLSGKPRDWMLRSTNPTGPGPGTKTYKFMPRN